MGKIVKLKEAPVNRPSIIDRINSYADSQNYIRKQGGYYDSRGHYIGSIFVVGRLGGIDMQEGK